MTCAVLLIWVALIHAGRIEGFTTFDDPFESYSAWFHFIFYLIRRVGGVEPIEKLMDRCPNWKVLEEIPAYMKFNAEKCCPDVSEICYELGIKERPLPRRQVRGPLPSMQIKSKVALPRMQIENK